MSTIASPRDPSAPFPRRVNSSQTATSTPTGSARASLDLPRPAGSPSPSTGAPFPPPNTNKRANRAALREYYNLKRAAAAAAAASGGGGGGSGTATPTLEVTGDSSGSSSDAFLATAPASELDAADFDAAAYVARALADSSLAQLLGAYARVAGEVRALDAEKKALVYDNYSKLISATDTIRRMRGAMDPLAPVVAGTLDPAIARVYEQASGMREALRREVPRPRGGEDDDGVGQADGDGADEGRRGGGKRRLLRTRDLALRVLEVPARMRRLVKEGKTEEARREWELPRRLLEKWKAGGVGGDDVDALIQEGDAILRSEGVADVSGSRDGTDWRAR